MSIQQEQQILRRVKQLPVAKFSKQLNLTNGLINPKSVPNIRRTGPLSSAILGNNNPIIKPSNKCQQATRSTRDPYNPYNIVQYEEPKQYHNSQEKHMLSYHLPGPNNIATAGVSSSSTSISSTVDSMVLVKESTLGVLTKQLTSSLTKMKEIEEQVKIIPELKQRLDYLINSYSEDEQTPPPMSYRATSNESMNMNRRLTKPAFPPSHDPDRKQGISSRVVSGRKLDARRNASSSCDHNRTRDHSNMYTKNNPISDTCSLGSLKLDDRFNSVDETKGSKVHCALSNRASPKHIDYDDIINDLFSLFDSFEVQSSLPENGLEPGRQRNLDSKGISPVRAELPQQLRVNQRQHSDYAGHGSSSLPHLPDNKATFKSSRDQVLTDFIEPMLEAVDNATDSNRYALKPDRSRLDKFDSLKKVHVPASRGAYKTYLTVNSTYNGRREAETQTVSDMPPESRPAPSKADLSTNTDLFMNDLITRKQLNELLQNLNLTPKQSMKCLMICSRTAKGSEMTNNIANRKKNTRTTKNQIQSDSTDDSDQTLSGGDTYSICSSHEDLSGFEGYFKGSYCRSIRDDFYQDSSNDLLAQVT